jgi:Spy/CpxP family protein refolding chaperone
MKTKVILLALLLGASTGLILAQDSTHEPDGQSPPPGEAAPGGPAGQGHGPRGPGGGFHLLPPRAAERLKLTADQQRQVADLEAETRAKLEKILTPAQMEQLKQMRPPRRPGGGGGPGGSQGGPEGGQDGSSGEGRPQPPPPGE